MSVNPPRRPRHRADRAWCCDPIHGNTEVVGNGVKTRRFDSILSELEQALEITLLVARTVATRNGREV